LAAGFLYGIACCTNKIKACFWENYIAIIQMMMMMMAMVRVRRFGYYHNIKKPRRIFRQMQPTPVLSKAGSFLSSTV